MSVTRTADYKQLVVLSREFRQFRRPVVRDGVPDYSPAAMKRQSRGLKAYRRRLEAIDSSGWPVAKEVDYHLVRAQMNGLEFDHRVMRPWFRDPAFYVVIAFQFGPKMLGAIPQGALSVPVRDEEELAGKLRAVPGILDQARENLTEGCGDLTMLGIRSKRREAGILQRFIQQLKTGGSSLVGDAVKALKAVKAFGAWLQASRRKMDAPSGIGIDNYNWHLRHVQLVPYNWHEIMRLSQREYCRAVATMKLQEHRNRTLPPLDPAGSGELITRKFRSAQRELWRYLNEGEVLTPPDYMKPRPHGRSEDHRGRRDYFVNVLHRDPLALMPHDVVGHTPDAIRHSRDRRPIRGQGLLYFISSFRAEGLATGIEEILLLSGMLDRRPRSRELTYNLLAHRAARSISDLKIHSNEFTLAEGFRHNVEKTPYRWVRDDSPMMWHDMELYLRQPSYGTSYTVGAVQMQQLIADVAMAQGKRFVLKRLMDRFLGLGMIPITLARWELTGRDDEIRALLTDRN